MPWAMIMYFYADSSIEEGTVGGAPPGAPEPSQLGKLQRVPGPVFGHKALHSTVSGLFLRAAKLLGLRLRTDQGHDSKKSVSSSCARTMMICQLYLLFEFEVEGQSAKVLTSRNLSGDSETLGIRSGLFTPGNSQCSVQASRGEVFRCQTTMVCGSGFRVYILGCRAKGYV